MPQNADSGHVIDVAFPVRGDTIPIDHGYALYATLSRLVGSWLHETDGVAVHPIRGAYAGDHRLRLNAGSRIALRLSAAMLPKVLPLTGKSMELVGRRLAIGIPQTGLLNPATVLYARIVTTRNGHDEARFDDEIRHQLDLLQVRGKPTRGKRRVVRIKDKIVVGHSLLVSELTADESLRLQERGLGGRRKMGCGVFSPWRG